MSVEFVIVRTANESKRTPPNTFMARDAAEELYQAGLAEWNKKRTALTLKKVTAEMYRPAPSLKPGVQVMDAYVEGLPTAIAIIHSYAAVA